MVERYRIYAEDCDPEIEKSDSGNWVRWLDYEAIRAELEAVKAELDSWRNAAFLSDCEARSGQLEEMTDRAEAAEARAAQLEAENGRLREAASYYIDRLERAWRGEPVRDMGEAESAYRAALTGREG